MAKSQLWCYEKARKQIEEEIREVLKGRTVKWFFDSGTYVMAEVRRENKYDYDMFQTVLDTVLDQLGWYNQLIKMTETECEKNDRMSLYHDDM